MLIDDLRLQLKEIEPDIQTILACYTNANIDQKYETLHEQVHAENFWKNPDQITLSKEYQRVRQYRTEYIDVVKAYNDNKELIELFADSEEELKPFQQDIRVLCKKILKFKVALLLNKEGDANGCFMSINSGAGGTESQDWAHMLLRMYLRFCERENLKADILDYQTGEEAGIKSATVYIHNTNATGLFRSEVGIHRLVRISPFDANKRRHTSFVAVSVTPEVADEKIEINDKDLRIDTYRAGGAGGQHVNKTDSAVRITHLPTNIVVQCQNERSQIQNRVTALKMLKAKLIEKQQDEKDALKKSVEKKKIEWGSQIRSYVLHPYKMVKDHRTEFESPQPDLVLDGEIMPFIESFLVARASEV
ncbi:MAG: peptide chain release factor 2 [bacterium]